MKRITILKTTAMVVLTVSMLIGNLFGQSATSTTQTVVQRPASEVLSDILKSTSPNILKTIYPPGFLDNLQAMGDSLYPPTPLVTKKSLAKASPMNGGMSPMDQTQQPIPTYTVIDLGTLDGGSSYVQGINNEGVAVGWCASGAFLYANGVMQSIAGMSQAFGINNKGQIVGYSGGGNDACLYSGGVVTNLGSLVSGQWSQALAINDSGEIVGYGGVHQYTDAFFYTNGVMNDLGIYGSDSQANAINNSGQIVGISQYTGANLAFLFTDGIVTNLPILPGGNGCGAYGINDSGQVVGWSRTTNSPSGQHGFLYSGSVMQDIGTLGGPAVALGINNSGQVVGGSDFSDNVTEHAFLYFGGTMYDLNNLLFNTNSGWVLQYAIAINNSGQIVGEGINPSGQTHAFLLNPLPAGSIQAASTVQTNLPPYGICPAPEEGQDSLIFITHGWINPGFPSYETPQQAIDSVNSMSNSIEQYLIANGLSNWRVYGYMWTDQATATIAQGGPETALNNAFQQGKIVGDCIASQGESGWKHIHFIAHSDGAGLIQKATEQIKDALSTNVTIQCTFLDAYDGLLEIYIPEWGYEADWSDSYFSRDLLSGADTQQPLLHAYNVDVTTLDPQASSNNISGFTSGTDLGTPCYKTESSHGWPIDFYTNTITGNTNSYYAGFGFPLSKEGGNWNYATNHYHPGNGFLGNGTSAILGPQDPNCVLDILPPSYLGSWASFLPSCTVTSLTGTLKTYVGSIVPGSGSPVWVATVITDTNGLNFVSFDAEFTSAEGSHGLLSVYWDTSMIGLIDEAAVQPGFQHYNLSFPLATANTSHVLGFHLDPFTSTQSTMILTNIFTGCLGVSQQPVLSITTNRSNGLLVYRLTGQADNYTVQASTDLSSTNWVNIAVLANTNGTVNFVDPNSANYNMRFYRAIAQ